MWGNITWLKSVSVMLYINQAWIDFRWAVEHCQRQMMLKRDEVWHTLAVYFILWCLLGMKISHGGWFLLFFFTCLNLCLCKCFYLIIDSPCLCVDGQFVHNANVMQSHQIDLFSSALAFLSLSREDEMIWDAFVVF